MKQYTDLSFQEFRERFSTHEPKQLFPTGKELFGFESNEFLYIVPNEDRVPYLREELEGENAQFYLGIIGGVTANLDYLTTAAKNSFVLLTDLNERAIDHLAFICYCANGIGEEKPNRNISKFLNNIFDFKLDQGKVRTLFGENSLGQTVDLSLYQDPTKRRIVYDRISQYLNQLPLKKRQDCWLTKVGIVNKALEEGRIKAYQSNLLEKGKDIAKALVHTSKAESLLLYLSDIRVIKPGETNSLILEVQERRELFDHIVGDSNLEKLVVVDSRSINRYNK